MNPSFLRFWLIWKRHSNALFLTNKFRVKKSDAKLEPQLTWTFLLPYFWLRKSLNLFVKVGSFQIFFIIFSLNSLRTFTEFLFFIFFFYAWALNFWCEEKVKPKALFIGDIGERKRKNSPNCFPYHFLSEITLTSFFCLILFYFPSYKIEHKSFPIPSCNWRNLPSIFVQEYFQKFHLLT